MKIQLYCLLFTLFPILLLAQNIATADYWKLSGDSGIFWDLTEENRLPHKENIEFSGRKVSAIIYYEVDSMRNLTIERDVIFPQLRTYNKSNEADWKKYRAYFRRTLDDEFRPHIAFENKIIIPTKVDSIRINGMITFHYAPVEGIQISRQFYPSMEDRYMVEEWTVNNVSQKSQRLDFANLNLEQSEVGYKGLYKLQIFSDADAKITLAANSSYSFPVYYGASLNDERIYRFKYQKAKQERLDFLADLKEKLQLETPDPLINQMFYFSKIRASESIFDSSMGLVHSPGGGNYYVGVWANDQVEYSGPFFPYLGYGKGKTAAYNTYKQFQQNIPEDDSHIPYAFEVDGNFAMKHLDRGDAAMIAYGTSHFLLASGEKALAKELWPLIEWSLEYCHKNRNEEGAILSESDEMEGRIETGDANLSTSALYYGGLKYSIRLAKDLERTEKVKIYEERLADIESVIENYFGANLEGLDTYKYFEANKNLRHWICLPLTMGITTRKEATLSALFDKLWTENGILVELNESSEKEPIFWDRATLYALRAALKAGAIDIGLSKLQAYTRKRLLGDHVPYAIEAYPENNMKHLSAESALYCRILTEGMLGIEPAGLNRVILQPSLPVDWAFLNLKNIMLTGVKVNIELSRKGKKLELVVRQQGLEIFKRRIEQNEKVELVLTN